MILTKILRAADHPYLMGKGGRMVIQIISMIITVTKMIIDDGNKDDQEEYDGDDGDEQDGY